MRRTAATTLATAMVVALTSVPTAQAQEAAATPLRAEVATAIVQEPDVLVDGSGFGHGVGMSQYGAYALAISGATPDEILAFYYTGTEVLDRPERSAVPIRVGAWPNRTTPYEIASLGAPSRWQTCSVVDGSQTCSPLTDANGPIVLPAGRTWAVGHVVEGDTPDAPAGFGIRRQDGVVLPLPAGTTRLRLVPDDGAVLFGRMPNTSGSVRFLDGFHEFRDRGDGSFHVVSQQPSIETYLRGLAEVPSSWGREGPSALEAQAIAGRTYAIRLHEGGVRSSCDCHILSTPANQNWTAGQKEQGLDGDLWTAAVAATQGRVVAYQGELIATFYSSSHGGRSENIEDSWAYGTTPFPYLVSVDDPWSLVDEVDGVPVNNSRAAWTSTVANADLAAMFGLDVVTRVEVLDRTVGGTPRELRVSGLLDGERTRLVWTRPGEGRKQIAGANLRIDLRDVDGAKLPSSQLAGFRIGPFDDDDGTLFEHAISVVAASGVAQGFDATSFQPGTVVTRGQMSGFLAAAVDLPAGTATFADVDPDGTFAAAIATLADAGIVLGDADGFAPSRTINRAELATLLQRTFALPVPADLAVFADVPVDGVHARGIAAVAAAGITSGCDDTSYCPTAPVTRGQMAQLLVNALRYAVDAAAGTTPSTDDGDGTEDARAAES